VSDEQMDEIAYALAGLLGQRAGSTYGPGDHGH